MKGITLQNKLTGGIRQDLILSPYSGMHLKPYIRRDAETFPSWLKLMAEIQLAANSSNADYILPPRAPLDYTYVQPEHIPAINSLCNQFFWPGIDRKKFLCSLNLNNNSSCRFSFLVLITPYYYLFKSV